jgi:hypothetical protein
VKPTTVKPPVSSTPTTMPGTTTTSIANRNSTSTTLPTTHTAPTASPAPTGPVESLTPAQVRQIDAELGMIGESLNQSANALDHPNPGDQGS